MDRYHHVRELPAYGLLTAAGRELLSDVFCNAPVRAVGRKSLLSVSGTHISPRFTAPLVYESRGCERAYILLAEHDKEVRELFSQPAKLAFLGRDNRGRRRHVRRTPDFLECRTDTFALVECKPLERLEKLASSSDDWVRDTNGRWRYIPGEEIAAQMGMAFRVFCPSDYPAALVANLDIAARFGNVFAETSDAVITRVRRLLAKGPMTVEQLCARYAGLTGGLIWAAISTRQLFGFIESQLFGPDFLVYESEPIDLHPFRRGGASPASSEIGPLALRLATASSSELEKAKEAAGHYDARRVQGVPLNSTDHRYKAAIAAAKAEGASRIAAFIPRFRDRGGNGPRIPLQTVETIASHATDYLKNGGLPIGTRLYADFCVFAEEQGLYCPSLETYRKHLLSALAPEAAALMSGGKRAFHRLRPRTDGADAVPSSPIAGMRVHIDGVYADVRAKPDEEGDYPRPIFYPMIDESTGYVLGRGVKVGRPSAGAVVMAFRDCFQRHGALPTSIMADCGSEFRNRLVTDTCAYFRVAQTHRPAGGPRWGGVGEMLNASFSTYLQSFYGGTYFDKAGRAADGDKKSNKTARHSISELVHAADHWLFEIWNRSPIGSSGESPEDLWLRSIGIFPEALIQVRDDALARYHTSVPLGGTKFDSVRGIKYAGRYYAGRQMSELMRQGQQLREPRLDSVDPSTIHVLSRCGSIELHSMEYQHTRELGHAQCMEEMHRLLTARSTARANQHSRNVKEARKVREMRAVLPPLPTPLSPQVESLVLAHARSVWAWDRSDISGERLPELNSSDLRERRHGSPSP